jgi:PilZ domain
MKYDTENEKNDGSGNIDTDLAVRTLGETAATSSNDAVVMQQISPRYQVDLRLEVVAGTRKLLARSHDVSLEGIAAYIPCELEVGQYIDILMKVPFKREDLSFGAIVRNRKGYRYGLEFSNLRRPHQDLLEGLCDTLGNLGSFSPFEA